MKNKVLSVVFALCFVLLVGCSNADVNKNEVKNGTVGGISWSMENGVLRLWGEGDMPDFDNYDLAKKSPWSVYSHEISEIVVEQGVTSIGSFAFSYLDAKQIHLPDSITEIDDYAFFACESLEQIVLPENVEKIGDYAFSQCFSVDGISIPASVKEIGNYAFYNCKALEYINVDEDNPAFCSRDGVLFDKAETVLLSYPSGKKSAEYVVPENTSVIGSGAFGYCKTLTSVELGGKAVSYGDKAFVSCEALKSITLPVGATAISERMFFNCKGLEEVVIPPGVTVIEEGAFAGCSALNGVAFPTSVTEIGERAFSGCSGIKNLTLPAALTKISHRAFDDCSGLVTIELPLLLEEIDNYAFAFCTSLENIIIKENLENVREQAFKGCGSLRNIQYSGTRAMWRKINIESGNDYLVNGIVAFPNEELN